MRKIYTNAVIAAHEAARAVANPYWLTGGTGSDIDDDTYNRLLRFIIDNPEAPAEAFYIRAGAEGCHDGKPYAEQPADIRIGFEVFRSTLLQVSNAIDEAQAAFERAAAEKAAAEAVAEPRVLTEADLEDTPFEKLPDPMAPSALGQSALRANAASDKKPARRQKAS